MEEWLEEVQRLLSYLLFREIWRCPGSLHWNPKRQRDIVIQYSRQPKAHQVYGIIDSSYPLIAIMKPRVERLEAVDGDLRLSDAGCSFHRALHGSRTLL